MDLVLGTSRRTFLQQLISASVFATGQSNQIPAAYAYIGSLGAGRRDNIEVFRVDGKHWTQVQQTPCRAPASLVLHPSGQFLYAANSVTLHENLPQGTVEVFSIDRQQGMLSAMQRRALSLSGTEPRGLAITPDGKYLVVAVYGGGAFNVLPIQQNGSLGAPSRIFKELGSGAHAEHQGSAHPHTVIFDRSGRFALASDFGRDRLSVFAVNAQGELCRKSEASVVSGAGPGPMVIHPGGSLLYVLHELKPAISCHRYRQTEGIIENHFQYIQLGTCQAGEAVRNGGLTIDSKGRFLYAAIGERITSMVIDPVSGSLSIQKEGGSANQLHISSDNRIVYAIDQETGCVSSLAINPATGTWHEATQVATVTSPVSLALCYC